MKEGGQVSTRILDSPIAGLEEDIFTALCTEQPREELAAALVNYLQSRQLQREDFPLVEQGYSRTIVFRTPNHFELMIARWSKGMVSVVHGHPDYAFYHLLEGSLGVEDFVQAESGLKNVKNHLMAPGDFFSMSGITGTLDNGIHRITVLEESLSVHVYSGDARQGTCFPGYHSASPFSACIEGEGSSK